MKIGYEHSSNTGNFQQKKNSFVKQYIFVLLYLSYAGWLYPIYLRIDEQHFLVDYLILLPEVYLVNVIEDELKIVDTQEETRYCFYWNFINSVKILSIHTVTIAYNNNVLQ